MAMTESLRAARARERAARKSLIAAARALRFAAKKVSVVGTGYVPKPKKEIPTNPPAWDDNPLCKVAFESWRVKGRKIPKELKVRGKDFKKAVGFMDEWMQYLLKTFNKAYPKTPPRRK